jgi:hypothetical protein
LNVFKEYVVFIYEKEHSLLDRAMFVCFTPNTQAHWSPLIVLAFYSIPTIDTPK